MPSCFLQVLRSGNPLYDRRSTPSCATIIFCFGVNFPESSVDAVLSFDVIEHISPNQIKDFLKEMKRVLKKNGSLIITTPNRRELRGLLFGHKIDPKHYKEFTIKELTKLLEDNGFAVKHKTGIYLPLPIPFVEHFASIYPIFWIFKLLVKLGIVFPNLSVTIFLTAEKV